MNPLFVSGLVDLVKTIAGSTAKIVDASDPQSYANAVNTMHSGLDQNYAMQREIIKADESLSTAEKLKLLKQIADEEMAVKSEFGQAIYENREKTAKIAVEVFQALVTGGISLIPSIYQKFVPDAKELNEKVNND